MPRCGQRIAHMATRGECRAICRLAKPSSAGSKRLPFGPAADNQTSNKSVRRKGRDQGAWLWVARACFTSFRVGRQHARSAVDAVGLVDCAVQATLHGPMGRPASSAVLAPQRATTATACDARSAGHAPSSAVLASQRATFAAACGACSAGRALSNAVLASQRATSAAACGARSAGRAPWSAVLAPQMATFAAACAACGARSCAVARGGGTRAYCLAGSHQG